MRVNTTVWNRARYSLYAPVYDLVARQFARPRRRAIELLAPRPSERVLIVGAGTGLDLDFLPRGVEVTAVDLTPAMLRRTAERARRLGLTVRSEVMDAERLDFPSASFECVLLHLILAVVPDPVACIREAARVLVPGGRVSIFDKFLPDEASASRFRRAANFVTSALFTDINRSLGPLLAAAGLERRYEEPSLLGGMFRIVIAGAIADQPRGGVGAAR